GAAEREAPVSIGRSSRGGRVKAGGEGVRPPAYGAPAEERRERRPRHHEDDGPPVIGLGDHVPSFLLRPVALRPAKVGEE
ncbi:DEAD/DEAH box helicase, partial [Methylocystis sp. NLS-7]|nr:DEAD/DEAH box helicase [Methylocystis suflitae]